MTEIGSIFDGRAAKSSGKVALVLCKARRCYDLHIVGKRVGEREVCYEIDMLAIPCLKNDWGHPLSYHYRFHKLLNQ